MNPLLTHTLKKVCAEKLGIVDQDIDAFIDPTLTYKENLEIIMAEYGIDSIVAMGEIESELARVLNQGKPKRSGSNGKKYRSLRWKVLSSQSKFGEQKSTVESDAKPEKKEHKADPATEIPTLHNIVKILSKVVPPKNVLTQDSGGENPIKFSSMTVYGEQRSGKTELTNAIIEGLNLIYGKQNVKAFRHDNNIEPLFEKLEDVMVNVLIGDNMTIDETTEETAQKFLEVGHILQEKTGRRTGLIMFIFVTHRITSINKHFRESQKLVWLKNTPTAQYSFYNLCDLVPESFLNDFLEKKPNPDWKDMDLTGWCRPRLEYGYVRIPMVSERPIIVKADPPQEPEYEVKGSVKFSGGTISPIPMVDIERQRRIQLRKQQEILKNIEKARMKSPISIPEETIYPQYSPNISATLPFRVQKRILKNISKGERKTNRIADLSKNPSDNYNRHNKRLWRETIAKGIMQMERDGLIEWGGLILKGWRLTSKGMWLLNSKRR